MKDETAAQSLPTPINRRSMTRRAFSKRLGALGLSLPALSGLLASCGGEDEDEPSAAQPTVPPPAGATSPGAGVDATATTSSGAASTQGTPATPPAQGQLGGTLRVGLSDVPASLDPHQNTADITRDITNNVVENLFTMDAAFSVVPDLAESFEASPDSLTYTITLRPGVTFHNSKEMTVDDVIASLNRWMALSTPGRTFSPSLDTITSPAEGVVELKFTNPIGHLLIAAMGFSYASAAILPKEQIDEVGTEGMIVEPIGSGPYKLESADLDKEIRLVRFEEYVPRTDPPSGMGGAKTAYFDEIVLIPTTEATVRASALEAGDLDFVTYLLLDDYARLQENAEVQTILQFYGSADFAFNNSEGLLTDKRIRKAIQAALDCDDLMFASFGSEEFYELDPGLYPKETPWWSDAGAENYNQNDPDKARQLLTEAGYDGTPIVWMSTEQGSDAYKRAIAAKAQLENAGLTVEVEVMDWATLTERRRDPAGGWNVFGTALDPQPDPTQYVVFDCGWYSFWCDDPTKDELMESFKLETDLEERFAIWEELQAHYWEEAPAFKVGNFYNLHAAAKGLRGYVPLGGSQIFLYNVWLEQ